MRGRTRSLRGWSPRVGSLPAGFSLPNSLRPALGRNCDPDPAAKSTAGASGSHPDPERSPPRPGRRGSSRGRAGRGRAQGGARRSGGRAWKQPRTCSGLEPTPQQTTCRAPTMRRAAESADCAVRFESQLHRLLARGLRTRYLKTSLGLGWVAQLVRAVSGYAKVAGSIATRVHIQESTN